MAGRKAKCSRQLIFLGAGLLAPVVAAQGESAAADASGGADDGETARMEEVVIYGVRQSLQDSVERKRMADDIRDVITTADIGNFPDQNLAEAVQRLPGVAITRSNGEGQFITVRGLPPELNRIAWNGMTLPSSGDDRAVPLDIFSADLFGSLAVVKSLSADKDEGAIGGSINLETPSPLQLPDNTLAVSAQTSFNSLAEEARPEGTALLSKHFLDGRLGVVGGLTYSDRAVRQDSLESGGWNPVASFFPTGDAATDELLVWENGKPVLVDEERERTTFLLGAELDLAAAGHYRLDVMSSSLDRSEERYQFLHRFKNAASISDVVGDGAKVVSADFSDMPVGINRGIFEEETESTLLSLRGDWTLDDQWFLDAQAGFMNLENSWPVRETYKFRPGGFDVAYDVGDRFNPRFSYLNVGFDEIMGSPELFDAFDELVLEGRESEDSTFRLESNLRYTPRAGFFTAYRGGLQWQQREKSRVQAKNKDKSNEQPLSDFLEGDGTSIPGDDTFLSGRQPWFGGVVAPLANFRSIIGPENVPLPPDLLASFDVEETTTSAYLRADFGRGRLRGNIGVRAIYTDLESEGWESVNGAERPVVFESDYLEYLPSATVDYRVRDDVRLRFSAGRALVKPQFPDVAPQRRVNEDSLSIAQGNPELEPFDANQADLSLEWYFDDGDLLAVAALYKDVQSFIFDQTRTLTLTDPVAFGVSAELAGETFAVTRPLNGDGAEVIGLEFIWQQAFDALPAPFSGFGVAMNYTYLDSNADFSANILGEDQDVGEGLSGQSFGLPGISDEVLNATLYHETARTTARLSYNYRSSFLLTPAGAEGQPQYVEDYGQLDLFLALDITPTIAVFAEAINITDEPLRQFSEPGSKIELYSETGVRFFAGVRAKF